MVRGFGYDGDDFRCRAREVRFMDELFDSEEFAAEQDQPRNTQDYISTELDNLPPLNLTLRKTPSFMNLLKTKLSKHAGSLANTSASQPASEKLKASNFPASFIRIGSWQEVSRNEADLVAKCYFSKKKLVWEVLKNGLKSKIEIQWSDISAIRASLRENQPGILEIELDQVPAFYRESNPQPRKHTIWHLTTDFTEGQASMHRRHYVRFPPGILDRHYEKLLQSDKRLMELSKKGFPAHDTPYFNWTPYEYNSYYYSFDGKNEDPAPETKPRVHEFPSVPIPRAPASPPDPVPAYHQHVQTPQWAIQPPLMMEEYCTSSPMSGSWDNTTTDPTNDHGSNHGFGDPGMQDVWGHGNHPTLYGEASSQFTAGILDNGQQHYVSNDTSTQCSYGTRFDLMARESSLHSLMGLSSGMDSTPSYGYDSMITSCTEQSLAGISDGQMQHQLDSFVPSQVYDGNVGGQYHFDSGYLYPPFVLDSRMDDSSGMNW